MNVAFNKNEYIVYHPIDDPVQEAKKSVNDLGLIKMTPVVKFSLMVLRCYCIAMMLMVLYWVLHLAHFVK